jgi:prephenate dehydrogenase
MAEDSRVDEPRPSALARRGYPPQAGHPGARSQEPGARSHLFPHVAIVGVGLIGGSIGLALRQRGLAERVTGVVRREATAAAARERGAVDVATMDIAVGVAEADLVILCAPVLTIPTLVEAMADALRPGTVVTDVGSTKAVLLREVTRRLPPECPFVGGHPMAGSERGGVEAARADLFDGATWVLCSEGGLTSPPTPSPKRGGGSEPEVPPSPFRGGGQGGEVTQRLARWVKALGASPVTMDAATHDQVVAAISHLPHVAAAALVNAVVATGLARDLLRTFIAGGFTSTSRIASSPPELWRDICLTNRSAVLEAIALQRRALERFEAALQQEDGEALLAAFTDARSAREDLIAP